MEVLFWFFFRKRSFLSDFSTEEVSSPLSLPLRWTKRKRAKGKRMEGEVVEVLEDAAWRRGVLHGEEFPPTHATFCYGHCASSSLFFCSAPRSHTHIYCTHTYRCVCVCTSPSFRFASTNTQRPTDRHLFYFLLFRSSSSSLLLFFTNCLISPVLPV